MTARAKWFIRFGAAAAIGVVAVLGLDALFPPDLSRYRDRSTVVLGADGKTLRAFLTTDGIWRLPATSDAVDSRYINLLKAYEDKRFDSHFGVDPLAVVRAAGQMAANGRIVSGASTLTMQTARLLEPGPRGIGAKIRQMVRALQLEWRYDKDEILSMYLTLAPFGGNLEGVRAASYAYFGKEPAALTTAQAALLVALPQSPEHLRPDRHVEAARAGRTKVLTRLRERGVLSARDFTENIDAPLPDGRRSFPMIAPRLARDLRKTHPDRAVIETTLDTPLQIALEDLVRRETALFDDGASIAVVAIENATRKTIAYVGGADFWGPHGQVDLADAVRSPGSALKPFIYGLAFDDFTVHPETLIDDRPMRFGSYAPRNFDRAHQGTITVRQALQFSLNVPAVALLETVGPARFVSTLRSCGARLALPGSIKTPSLPVALGGVGISLKDLTALYAGMAALGKVSRPRILKSDPVTAQCRLMDETAAWYVGDVLRGAPLPDGWGQAQGIVRDRQIAFKTGTSYGFRDAWAVGYSPAYTAGVWVGRPDGTVRPGKFGRNDAAPILLQVFSNLPKEPAAAQTMPENVLIAQSLEDLPAAMRTFTGSNGPKTQASIGDPPPQITFPPQGATVILKPDYRETGMPLMAAGGTRPLRWLVNGHLIPRDEKSGRSVWIPDGHGFTEVTVIDADGRSESSSVRLVD